MTTNQKIDASLRDAILSQPDAILDDKDVMHALIAANEKTMGANIVDLRGIAMDRLENRLDRLEDTHRSVIAAAYENLTGTHQIHRAVLRMLDAAEFEVFLRDLNGEIAEILRVDAIRLVLETEQPEGQADMPTLEGVLGCKPAGFVEAYVTAGRASAPRPITLRQVAEGDEALFGSKAQQIRSEACLVLDLGPGRLPALLVLGSKDENVFGPQQGTDLLAFFAGVFERVMRRWLT
ncbi:MAG: DUF484 family protein [Pseudomonadota bacterium]